MACVRSGVSYKRHHWKSLGQGIKHCTKCDGFIVPEQYRDKLIALVAEKAAEQLRPGESAYIKNLMNEQNFIAQ